MLSLSHIFLFFRLHNPWRAARRRHTKRKNFIKCLNSRTMSEWIFAWREYDISDAWIFCKTLSEFLDFPNFFIFPTDSFRVVHCDPWWDTMASVGAWLKIEEALGEKFVSPTADISPNATIADMIHKKDWREDGPQ